MRGSAQGIFSGIEAQYIRLLKTEKADQPVREAVFALRSDINLFDDDFALDLFCTRLIDLSLYPK